MVKEARHERTHIRVLGSPSVICHQDGCEEPASFLFRTGDGPIAGYCEVHARQEATRLGMSLPDTPMKVLRANW